MLYVLFVRGTRTSLGCALRTVYCGTSGGGEALSQVQVGESRLLSEAGSTGFLLWRSVYVVKQVSPRTRFLVLFDWLKTKIFGRDVTSW